MAVTTNTTSKRVEITVNVWNDEGTKAIHVSSNEVEGFNVAVTNVPGQKRYHETMYKHLRGVLVDAGKWPTNAD